ncbi:MAG: hydrolase [Planctomycetaceae bacterium]|nr:hydrolase [Planctomycetaceae bacterium]|tara:strand:- start:321 stop:902 length:582 start_codon:yes stop_codon:yes gene_type:complete
MTLPPRSPELMNADDTALLVVDVQEKLIPVIRNAEIIQWNISRLLQAADALDIPAAATEQYPQGLGHTTIPTSTHPEIIEEKTMFSCRETAAIFTNWADAGIRKFLICGIETHVCIQQTVMDLLAEGFQIYLAIDALGARHDLDHQTGLRRMEGSGAVLTTTEAAMFEWCETATNPAFKTISGLVRQAAPTGS